ncbi:MAG: type II toxin-antitoxin system RelE/ParE family toxin [Novosphingobium sp.]
MTDIYEVEFRPRAAKAFEKLASSIQTQLSRKLNERRSHPRVPADRVREMPDGYRLKLRAAGVRLVYQVHDGRLLILVLSVGSRDGEKAYKDALREYIEVSQ